MTALACLLWNHWWWQQHGDGNLCMKLDSNFFTIFPVIRPFHINWFGIWPFSWLLCIIRHYLIFVYIISSCASFTLASYSPYFPKLSLKKKKICMYVFFFIPRHPPVQLEIFSMQTVSLIGAEIGSIYILAFSALPPLH